MKVLVTGATGTLGERLVPALRPAGHHVRRLSRRAHSETGIEWVRDGLRTGEGIHRSVAGVETILHAATLGGVAHGKGLRAHPRGGS